MKKIMAALLVLSLAACKSDSPEAVLKQAYEKDKDTQSITMDGEMGIEMTIEGFTLNIPIDLNIMTDKHDPDTITDDEMFMDMSLSLLGESMKIKLWFVDGVLYMDTNGSRTKTDLEITDPEDKPDIEGMLKEILSIMDDLGMEKDGDNTVITGQVNKDRLLEMLKKLSAQYGSEDAYDSLKESFESVEFGKIRIVIGKDGYIDHIETDGTVTIEDTAGNITVAFDLKDRNSTTIPAVNPAEYEAAEEEDMIDNVIDDGLFPGDDEEEFEFDDYTTEIWFDDGSDYWIRSPQSEGVSLYYSEEDQELYFFDEDSVLAAGMFIETGPLVSATAGIIDDTENYQILRAENDRGMNIMDGLCLNETDLMYADTQFLIVLYPERTYSLVIFSNTSDQDRFSEVMKKVDFDLAH